MRRRRYAVYWMRVYFPEPIGYVRAHASGEAMRQYMRIAKDTISSELEVERAA